ncbi:hypothetical protein IAE35_19860 [Pseudomonas sp. S75]|uniref:hypothetical protein n=1 Tax=Pseudomonas sp. S75 TaxID=2767446 RepID=UPI0019091D8E|nr:hypothetical protein [Pseudomonas sp. S75]MBK0155600.1 hypothetical protein [Pseudomonas sp. S75]
MKKTILLALAFMATEVSAAGSIYFSTELTRNGEVVDKFSSYATDGVVFPHRNVKSMSYSKAIRGGQVVKEDLELGAVSSITPIIVDDGKILVRYKVDYVRLTKLDTTKVGKLTIELPQTERFTFSNETVIASGDTITVPDAKNENARYVYKITAQIQ